MGMKARKRKPEKLTLDDLVIEEVPAYRVVLRGTPISDVKATRPEAEAYRERVFKRRGDDLLIGLPEAEDTAVPQNGRPKHRRGGPYRYTLPTGETGRIETDTKKHAAEILARNLGRKRIPKGTVIEPVR